jgi:multidrug resistance efflux pump
MEEKMDQINEPDSLFLERLEWQLTSEFRRANRLKSPSGKIAVPRGIIALALVVGGLTTGVAAIKAAEYVKDSWRKKIEIARAETEVNLKKAHLESVREMESRAKMQVSDGLIQDEEYQMMRFAAERAELDLKKSMLNLDEVKISGEIPSNELFAPLVGGRDFVSERLEIEREEIERDSELLKSRLRRIEQLVEAHLAPGDQLAHIQADIAAQEVTIGRIQKQLALRRRFLGGEITAQEVEIQDRLAVAERNMHLARSKVDALEVQMKRLKALEAEGMISETEIKQLQFALTAAQAELKLAGLEMDVLQKAR